MAEVQRFTSLGDGPVRLREGGERPTARLMILRKTVGLPETPLGGAPASVPSAGTSKPIKLMVFA